MDDAYILCNLTKFFLQKKMIKMEKRRPWHNRVKTHQPSCVNIQIFQLLKGGIN
jgi:hypothetical protein